MGWAGQAGPLPFAIATETFKYVVHENPTWDWNTVNFDTDASALEKKFAGVVDATNPDLSAFMSRGGKLRMYHGWNDQLIAPRNSIDYFNNVLYTMGMAKTSDGMRLYMVPGMNHCRGGDGTSNFDMAGELENRVERGKAPSRIVAARTNPVALQKPSTPWYPLRWRLSNFSEQPRPWSCRAFHKSALEPSCLRQNDALTSMSRSENKIL